MSRLEELIQEFCPDGVRFYELREIFDIKNGYTPSKSNASYWENGSIPWFRLEDIRTNGRVLNDSLQHVTNNAVKKSGLFKKNSIMISTTATLGEHAMILTDYLSNQQMTNLTIKNAFVDKLLPKFVFYYCFEIDKECYNIANYSGGIPIVNQKKFEKLTFPLPPLKVQQEIVRILDQFTELTAELTAELAARKKQYEYYRDELLTFGNETEWKTIRDICKGVSSGGTPSTKHSEYYGGTIPWLRTQEVDWADIWDTGIKITEEGLKNSSAKWIPENCVIVAMYGATAAKVAINKIPLTTNQACCNLQIDETIARTRYVFYWLSSEYLRLKNLGQGSQSNISGETVKQYPIPIPSLEVQDYIVSILDRFDALCNDLTSGLPAEIEARKKQYEYYRDKLLTFKSLSRNS